MAKIIDMILTFSIEELRRELCIEVGDYKLFKLRQSQIINKLREVEEMLNKQAVFHKRWTLHKEADDEL